MQVAAFRSKETCLQREETDLAPPFFRVASRPDDQQILNGETDIKILRDNDQPWTRAAIEESCKMCRHGLAVMRNQNPPRPAARWRTSGSGTPITPPARASSKSTTGSRRRRPRTIFWLKSASAWNRGLMCWGLAPRAGRPPAWNKALDAYAELRLAYVRTRLFRLVGTGRCSPDAQGKMQRPQIPAPSRSEERRVGKECRSRWSP